MHYQPLDWIFPGHLSTANRLGRDRAMEYFGLPEKAFHHRGLVAISRARRPREP